MAKAIVSFTFASTMVDTVAPAHAPLSDMELLLIGAACGALTGMIIAAAVAHGVMQQFLEARGVAPWSARDSIGALPVVLAGAGMMGAGFSLAVLAMVDRSGMMRMFPTFMIALPLALVGALVLRLGLLELRKLI